MAGKSVVYNMLDRDWTLDEILEERAGTVEDVSAYVNPLEDTDRKYTRSSGLTADGTVKEIAAGAELNAWWVGSNTDETMLSGLNEYEEGVIRRRALSKALFDASGANNSMFTGAPPTRLG